MNFVNLSNLRAVLVDHFISPFLGNHIHLVVALDANVCTLQSIVESVAEITGLSAFLLIYCNSWQQSNNFARDILP